MKELSSKTAEAFRTRVEPATEDPSLTRPELLDFSEFGTSQSIVQSSYEALYEWLQLPSVHDRWPTHQERRAAYTLTPAEDVKILEDNKLRGNALNNVLGRLNILKAKSKDFPEALRKNIRDLLEREPSVAMHTRDLQAFLDREMALQLRSKPTIDGVFVPEETLTRRKRAEVLKLERTKTIDALDKRVREVLRLFAEHLKK